MLSPTDFQARVLAIPSSYNIALLGGRGGGKSFAALLLALAHCHAYPNKARVLILRQSFAGLREAETNLDLLLATAYGDRVKANRSAHVWNLPNSTSIETGFMESPGDFVRYQGRSISMLIVDEAGELKTLKWFDLLKSNLRVPDVPNRTIIVGNPGGRAHSLLQARYVANRVPWLSYKDDANETWVYANSTYRDNPNLPLDYETKLIASTGKDEALLKSWRDGSFDVARGAMFATCIDQTKQMVPAELSDQIAAQIAGRKQRVQTKRAGQSMAPNPFYAFLAGDFGTASPSVFFACIRLLRPWQNFPRGSLLLIDEFHSADPDDLSTGLGYSVSKLADGLREMCARTNVAKFGVVDDARGIQNQNDTLINMFRDEGFVFHKPVKGRASGWAAMRNLLAASMENSGQAGLWISERCKGWWETVPTLARDPTRPDDLDSSSVDHWADSCRYSVTHQPRLVRSSHRPV